MKDIKIKMIYIKKPEKFQNSKNTNQNIKSLEFALLEN